MQYPTTVVLYLEKSSTVALLQCFSSSFTASSVVYHGTAVDEVLIAWDAFSFGWQDAAIVRHKSEMLLHADTGV